MGKKQYLYHATTRENAEKIRREGLKRQNKPWIYLSERPTSWWQPGFVVLRVRITGLKYSMWHWREIDEILVEGDINPERIMPGVVALPRRFVQNWETNHFRGATKMIKGGDGDV